MLLNPASLGIRLDSGVYEGRTVPIDYDPLLAKLIGYGKDRPQAISRLIRGLRECFIGGIRTNIELFRRILADEEFSSGKIDTGYLDRLLGSPPNETDEDNAKIAAVGAGVFAALDSASRAS